MKRKEAVRLVNNILWVSTDKDNMEFKTERVSCYQLDALRQIVEEYHFDDEE